MMVIDHGELHGTALRVFEAAGRAPTRRGSLPTT